MHSHIAIEGPSGPLTLKPDADLTITDKNPMFNDVKMFSQPIQLPFETNRHLLKNMDDVNSDMRPAELNEQKFGIIVDGLPLRQALIKIQEGVNLDGCIDVNFDSFNRSFKDMIADLKCRDIPVDNDIVIGEKIGDVHMQMSYQEILRPLVSCSKGYIEGYEIKMKPANIDDTFQPFALGFSFPGECYENATQWGTCHYHQSAKRKNVIYQRLATIPDGKILQLAHRLRTPQSQNRKRTTNRRNR